MYRNWITFFCIWIFTTQLNATTVFSDGGTHAINSLVFDDILLENGSSLNITQGGLVITTDSNPAITDSSPYYDGTNSSVNLSGNATVFGNIILHHDYYASGPDTTLIARDNALIVGTVGGPHIIDLYDNARIIGGATDNTGGTAIDNLTSRFNYVNMHGGEVVGGHGDITGGTGMDAGTDALHVQITDGVVRGGDGDEDGGMGVRLPENGSLVMTGGSMFGGDGGVTGGTALSGGFDMDISGGEIRGGNGKKYGGTAMSIYTTPGTGPFDVNIFGGEFDAGSGNTTDGDGWILRATGSSTSMSIYGGMFGYDSVGAGFYIGGSTVNVYGWDLKFKGGLLTGYLSDGNWIEVPVIVDEGTSLGRGLRLFNRKQPWWRANAEAGSPRLP